MPERVDFRKNLARRLQELRGDMTQRAFAERIGISQPHLNRIEQAKENVTLRTLQTITDRLKCSIGWLLDDTRGPERSNEARSVN